MVCAVNITADGVRDGERQERQESAWAFYPVLRSLGFIPRTKDAGE